MENLTKIFSRHYSAVNVQDTEQQQQQLTVNTKASNSATATTATGPYTSRVAEKQQNKSLKASRKMNPAGILSSFFNERKSNKRARSPKCKLNVNDNEDFFYFKNSVLWLTEKVKC